MNGCLRFRPLFLAVTSIYVISTHTVARSMIIFEIYLAYVSGEHRLKVVLYAAT